MAREGRELERLVALIEEAVSPENATVKSPDFIEDRITGQKREVDVSILARVGSSTVLVVIECRDRDGSQDVTWIEQVAQKGNDLKASKTVVVSAGGFSEAARKKAGFLGIETRRLDDVSPEVIRGWYQADAMEVINHHADISYCGLNLDWAHAAQSLEAEIFEIVKGMKIDSEIFLCAKDGKRCSLSTIWSWARTTVGDAKLYAGVSLDGTRIERKIRLNFPNPAERYQLPTSWGSLDVLSLDLVTTLWIDRSVSPIERVVSYRGDNRDLVEAVQYQVPLGNGLVKRLSFVKDKETGAMSVVLSPLDEK